MPTGRVGDFESVCDTKTPEPFRTDWIANLDAKLTGPGVLSSMLDATPPALRPQDTPGSTFLAKLADAQAATTEAGGGTIIAVQACATRMPRRSRASLPPLLASVAMSLSSFTEAAAPPGEADLLAGVVANLRADLPSTPARVQVVHPCGRFLWDSVARSFRS